MIRGVDDPVYRRMHDKVRALDRTLLSELPTLALIRQSAAEKAPRSWTRWIEAYRNSVHLVEVTKPNKDIASGTAFSKDGRFLLTAAHNVEHPFSVLDSAQKRHAPQRVWPHPDAKRGVDVALVELESSMGSPTPLPLADDLPALGEPVAAIGYASVPQRQPTLGVYDGHVEAISESYDGETKFIQVGMRSAGGLSGSPLINRAGQVVGIMAEHTLSENVSDIVPGREFPHAAPIAYAREMDASQPHGKRPGRLGTLFDRILGRETRRRKR